MQIGRTILLPSAKTTNMRETPREDTSLHIPCFPPGAKPSTDHRFWTSNRRLGSWNYAGDIAASHKGSRSTTPLLRNPTELRRCSQHAGANVDFGDEGAMDWAFLGNLKQLRALLLG